MSVVPSGKVAQIQWFEDRNSPWSTNATAIGTTTTEVTALATKVAAARTAYDAQQAAQNVAKDATLTLRMAMSAMNNAGSDIIKKIRAKAATDGNSVYALASMPAPALPSPVPPPGTPTDFKATLNPDGSLQLRWKCANPKGGGGTIYNISRKIGSGAFVAIGSCGKRSFIDSTFSGPTSSITYQIVAIRTTTMGFAAQFVVNFGVGEGGVVSASVSPRLAA